MFGHAVLATDVAAIGDANTQVAMNAAESIDDGWQVGHELGDFGCGVAVQ